jgi:hypothetical protein
VVEVESGDDEHGAVGWVRRAVDAVVGADVGGEVGRVGEDGGAAPGLEGDVGGAEASSAGAMTTMLGRHAMSAPTSPALSI